ncbi:phenylalanine--tRNA ligase [Balamuthia mandrillaris]
MQAAAASSKGAILFRQHSDHLKQAYRRFFTRSHQPTPSSAPKTPSPPPSIEEGRVENPMQTKDDSSAIKVWWSANERPPLSALLVHSLLSSGDEALALSPVAPLALPARFVWEQRPATATKAEQQPPELVLSPSGRILRGDLAIARYIAACGAPVGHPLRPSSDPFMASLTDQWLNVTLEFTQETATMTNKEHKRTAFLDHLNQHLTLRSYLAGNREGLSIADIALWTLFKWDHSWTIAMRSYNHVSRWFKYCDSLPSFNRIWQQYGLTSVSSSSSPSASSSKQDQASVNRAENGDSSTDMKQTLLHTLAKDKTIPNHKVFAEQYRFNTETLVGLLKSLEAQGVVCLQLITRLNINLTAEGQQLLKLGSLEARIWRAIGHDEVAKELLLERLEQEGTPVMPAAFEAAKGRAIKQGWLRSAPSGSNLVCRSEKHKDSIEDTVKDSFVRFIESIDDEKQEKQKEKQKEDEKERKKQQTMFRKRGLIKEDNEKYFVVLQGPEFSTNPENKKAVELTSEMIASGAWKDVEFKALNLDARGLVPKGGRLHPLMVVRSAFRDIFLEMGFEEMPSGRAYVESSFWNFDALFQPQQHPARDAHDTFFLSEPASMLSYPEEYLQRVKDSHETGAGSNSIGWRYDWKLSEASKNVLRTHTTAVSSRMLYQLAQQQQKEKQEKGEFFFTPKKLFSIDRVFRNETVDRTHLAEFHQVEGLVADYDVTLGDLIGVISQFFHKLGMHDLRFKPAYNPYTEPSMEIFAYHEGLGKFIEIGNSGVFRPEMLVPMGLDPEVKVLAWGLSLERFVFFFVSSLVAYL